jgi:hypothetical protein
LPATVIISEMQPGDEVEARRPVRAAFAGSAATATEAMVAVGEERLNVALES